MSADMNIALRSVRRLALARTPAEIEAARREAADVLEDAGWCSSADQVRRANKEIA